MKNKVIFVLCLLFAFNSCKEYTVKTKVNEDGSVEKTVEVVSRNRISDYQHLIVPLNDKWTIINERDSSNDVFRLTAKRKFENVSELIDEYGSAGGTVIEVNHEIRSRWFYTYYRYEEIIESKNPFKTLSVQDYLTQSEYKQLESGEISDTLESKLEEYLQHAMTFEFVGLLKERNILVNNQERDIKSIDMDELRKKIIVCSDLNEGMVRCIVDYLISVNLIKDEQKNVEDVRKIIDEIESKVENLVVEDAEYKFAFDMPGMILETNAQSIEGSTASWTFSSDNFAYTNYKMYAESRVINITNIIITGIAVLVLLSILIIAIINNKNKRI